MVRSILILALLSSAVCAQDVSFKAKQVLDKNCLECHGIKREGDKDFDVRNWRYLTDPNIGLVTPGSVTNSRIMQRIHNQEMPPKPKSLITKEEEGILTQWISMGAKSWDNKDREFITERYITSMIGYDINHHIPDYKSFRYVSLANIYNDGASEYEVQKGQEAVTKVMNYLAKKQKEIKKTEVLDQLGLVIRINLKDFGWTEQDWNLVVDAYPFGDGSNYIRADWFVMNVSQPPLYYQIRGIPETQAEFEKALKIKKGSVARIAGVTDSQVAIHNRLIRRYDLEDGGYYWKTSNIKDDNDSSVLDLPNFKSDYSVSLYTLENGLHGWAVFEPDEKDKDKPNPVFNREDKVDVDAEFDPTRISGTPHPVPMISCIHCHIDGIKTPINDVTGGTAIQFLEPDKNKFLTAYQKISTPIEPVGVVAERYNRPVDLDCAAKDKGLPPKTLVSMIQSRKDLFLLRPLLEGKTVTRKIWQDVNAGRVAKKKEE